MKNESLVDIIDRRHPARVPQNTNILLTLFAYGTLILAGALLILVAFWTLYPYQVITVGPDPLPIVGSKVLRQGEEVVYEYNYEKFTDLTPTVSRQFVDGLIFEASSQISVTKEGKGIVRVPIIIPRTLPPGKYFLKITATYHVNPIRDIEIVTETDKFLILPENDHEDAQQDEKEAS